VTVWEKFVREQRIPAHKVVNDFGDLYVRIPVPPIGASIETAILPLVSNPTPARRQIVVEQ
jgi:hypothetical protein